MGSEQNAVVGIGDFHGLATGILGVLASARNDRNKRVVVINDGTEFF